MYCIRHIQNNSGIFITLFFQLYAGIFNHIQRYWGLFRHVETLLRHIQAYSGIFSILCNLHILATFPYILSPSIFRGGGLFKTLWKVDQVYSEPGHRALFIHIQPYAELCATLAYAESGIIEALEYIRNPSSPAILMQKFTNIQNSAIFKTRHRFITLLKI